MVASYEVGCRRIPALTRHMERISALSKTKQKFVIRVIETVLAQQGR